MMPCICQGVKLRQHSASRNKGEPLRWLAGWPSTPKIYLGHAEGSYIKDVPMEDGRGGLPKNVGVGSGTMTRVQKYGDFADFLDG